MARKLLPVLLVCGLLAAVAWRSLRDPAPGGPGAPAPAAGPPATAVERPAPPPQDAPAPGAGGAESTRTALEPAAPSAAPGRRVLVRALDPAGRPLRWALPAGASAAMLRVGVRDGAGAWSVPPAGVDSRDLAEVERPAEVLGLVDVAAGTGGRVALLFGAAVLDELPLPPGVEELTFTVDPGELERRLRVLAFAVRPPLDGPARPFRYALFEAGRPVDGGDVRGVRDPAARVVRSLPPGTWRLLVRAPDAALLRRTVDLEDRDVDLGELVLEPPRDELVGQVVRAGGALPAGARVRVDVLDAAGQALLGELDRWRACTVGGSYTLDADLGRVALVALAREGDDVLQSARVVLDAGTADAAPRLEVRPRVAVLLRAPRARPDRRWRVVTAEGVEWDAGDFSRSPGQYAAAPPGAGRAELLDEAGEVLAVLPFEARAGMAGIALEVPDR